MEYVETKGEVRYSTPTRAWAAPVLEVLDLRRTYNGDGDEYKEGEWFGIEEGYS